MSSALSHSAQDKGDMAFLPRLSASGDSGPECSTTLTPQGGAGPVKTPRRHLCLAEGDLEPGKGMESGSMGEGAMRNRCESSMEAKCECTARRAPTWPAVPSCGRGQWKPPAQSTGKQFPEFGGSPGWITLVTSLFNASLLYYSKSHGLAGLIYL